MTTCTCQKWRDQSFRSDINLCVVSSTGGWRYCPWCSASLTAPEKPREEAEWRLMGPKERPDRRNGDQVRFGNEDWFLTGHEAEFTVAVIGSGTYRTRMPLPTQPEE